VPDDDTMQEWYTLGQEYWQRKDWKNALRWFEKITSNDSINHSSRIFQEATDKVSQAKTELELSDLYDRATLAFKNKDWEQAAALFQEIAHKRPNYKDDVNDKLSSAKKQFSLVSLYTEGLEHLRTSRWQEAIESFERVAAIDANYEAVQTKLASAKEQKRKSELYDNGKAEYEHRHWREAISWFEQIKGHRDVDVLLAESQKRLRLEELYQKGADEYRRENWVSAQQHFNEVLRLHPDYEDVTALLATIRTKIDDEKRRGERHRKAKVNDRNWNEIGAIVSMLSFVIAVASLFVQVQLGSANSNSNLSLMPDVLSITNCLENSDVSIIVTDSQNNVKPYKEGEPIQLAPPRAYFEVVFAPADCASPGMSTSYTWSVSVGNVIQDKMLPSNASYLVPESSDVDALVIKIQVPEYGFERSLGFPITVSR